MIRKKKKPKSGKDDDKKVMPVNDRVVGIYSPRMNARHCFL